MTTCRRCGRVLKSEKAIENGIGSHCKKLEHINPITTKPIMSYFETWENKD